MYFYKNVPLRRYSFLPLLGLFKCNVLQNFSPHCFFLLLPEMARGSMSGGRERMMTNSVGNLSHHPPTSLQDDLNNELNAVSALFFRIKWRHNFLSFPLVAQLSLAF